MDILPCGLNPHLIVLEICRRFGVGMAGREICLVCPKPFPMLQSCGDGIKSKFPRKTSTAAEFHGTTFKCRVAVRRVFSLWNRTTNNGKLSKIKNLSWQTGKNCWYELLSASNSVANYSRHRFIVRHVSGFTWLTFRDLKILLRGKRRQINRI